ncbi:MAG: hypothetical protein KIS76_13165 [Pyrinomonadaceae bacterium]|nr:hypothetical protein [Pyrinomonadaceae bacterium]
MKINKLSIAVSAAFCLVFSVAAFGQTETFSDPNVDYTFDISDTNWKLTSRPSNISPNVSYVYGTRSDGYLEVRKLSIDSGEEMRDVIKSEEDSLQFKPGFVAGKEESFSGNLPGRVYNFEFLKSGRNWSGRYYFLKADDNTVYVMRFEGYRDKLLSLRNVIDSMARTFNIATGK